MTYTLEDLRAHLVQAFAADFCIVGNVTQRMIVEAIDIAAAIDRNDREHWARDQARITRLSTLLAERDAEIERMRLENIEQASQLLDPNATCCADATRRTKELREEHAQQLAERDAEVGRLRESADRLFSALDDALGLADAPEYQRDEEWQSRRANCGRACDAYVGFTAPIDTARGD